MISGGCNMIFFFSSRRRHTRLTCDWSSDVCSSDLCEGWMGPLAVRVDRQGSGIGKTIVRAATDWLLDRGVTTLGLETRSEERRVGKECRSRWWPDHYEQNHKHIAHGKPERTT